MRYILSLLVFFLCGITAALEIRCTSDLHGDLKGLADLTAALEIGTADILRVDAGDTIQGSFLSRNDKGRSMIAALNLLKFDIWVPGNHDFEFGEKELSARCREFKGTVLGADWHCAGFVPKPWILLHKDGKRVAVIGLTEPNMAKRLPANSGFSFKPPLETLTALMPQIRKAKPDFVILVWHNGLFSRLGPLSRILRKFPEIDLVIGAHSHEEHPGKRIGNAYFIQPGKHAQAAGAVTLRPGNITSRLLRPARTPLPPELKTLVENTLQISDALKREVITLEHTPAEALRRQFKTDAAVMTFRPPFKHRMTRQEHFDMLPYENIYVTRFFTPAEFRKFCKQQTKDQKRWGMVLDTAGKLPPQGGTVALSFYLASRLEQ